MKRSILIFLAVLFVQTISAQTSINRKITVAEFDQELQKRVSFQLLDVRTPDEYNKGHIKHAVNANINTAAFQDIANKLDKSNAVFVYCHSGARSTKAAASLVAMGFREVYDLEGGIVAWTNSGRKVVGTTSSP